MYNVNEDGDDKIEKLETESLLFYAICERTYIVPVPTKIR